MLYNGVDAQNCPKSIMNSSIMFLSSQDGHRAYLLDHCICSPDEENGFWRTKPTIVGLADSADFPNFLKC